jgi:hypothetical protein
MVISLPLSRFGLSVAQLLLLLAWLIEGHYKQKIKAVFQNKALLVLVSFYMMHLLGLIYTNDFSYALKDIRVKLPLLFLPIVFATSKPLENFKIDNILKVFIAATLVSTFISFGIYITTKVSDFRELSPFISHIRLSLNVCLAMFFSSHFIFKKYKGSLTWQIVYAFISVWLILFLVMVESLSGIFISIVTLLILLGFIVFQNKSIAVKTAIVIIIIAIPVTSFIYLKNTANDFLYPHKNDLLIIDNFTAKGNPYINDTTNNLVENGSYIGLYVCIKELREEWNQRSSVDFDGKDAKNQPLKHTLIRYLNSLNLRKDAKGISKLSQEDIQNIEMGIANVVYTHKFHPNSRYYKILWEYQILKSGQNPGGHSVIQRLEFWRISWEIVKDQFILGVGTGDIVNAYQNKYEEMNSVLPLEFRHRAHNQYLAIFVTFGIIGLLWFIVSLVYPGIKLGKFLDYRYAVFWITIVLSMLVEDTLETQMGATLFGFFNAFLLFAGNDKSNKAVD